MKRFIGFSVALGLVFAVNGLANATDFAQTGKVDVILALSVVQDTELDFGTVSANDGTITLDSADTISADPSGISAGGTIASGEYTISGQSGNVVTVTLTPGSQPAGLVLSSFTADQPLGTITLTGGNATIKVGADLQVIAASVTTGNDKVLNFTLGVTYN